MVSKHGRLWLGVFYLSFVWANVKAQESDVANLPVRRLNFISSDIQIKPEQSKKFLQYLEEQKKTAELVTGQLQNELKQADANLKTAKPDSPEKLDLLNKRAAIIRNLTGAEGDRLSAEVNIARLQELSRTPERFAPSSSEKTISDLSAEISQLKVKVEVLKSDSEKYRKSIIDLTILVKELQAKNGGSK